MENQEKDNIDEIIGMEVQDEDADNAVARLSMDAPAVDRQSAFG